jgi:hypothetical protein
MTTSLNLSPDLDKSSLNDQVESGHDSDLTNGLTDDDLYPSGDGKPLAESTEQYRKVNANPIANGQKTILPLKWCLKSFLLATKLRLATTTWHSSLAFTNAMA